MRLAGAFALAALVLATAASATTIARVTLPEMARSSTLVFVADVRAASAEDGFDEYRLAPVRFLRGGPSRRVTLSVPAAIPGIGLGLEVGKRYLIFAEQRTFFAHRTRLTATGFYQGVYRVLGERAANESNGGVALGRLPELLRREARVRVTLIHDVDVSKRAYIEGAAYVVHLERRGRVVAKESGFLENAARFRVAPGWYVVASGAHPCGGPCRAVDFQDDLGVDACRQPVRLLGARATIRVVATAGSPCRVELG